jgi:hypothetical protein
VPSIKCLSKTAAAAAERRKAMIKTDISGIQSKKSSTAHNDSSAGFLGHPGANVPQQCFTVFVVAGSLMPHH